MPNSLSCTCCCSGMVAWPRRSCRPKSRRRSAWRGETPRMSGTKDLPHSSRPAFGSAPSGKQPFCAPSSRPRRRCTSFLALCSPRNRRLRLDGSERRHGSACRVLQRVRQRAVRSVFPQIEHVLYTPTRQRTIASTPALPRRPPCRLVNQTACSCARALPQARKLDAHGLSQQRHR